MRNKPRTKIFLLQPILSCISPKFWESYTLPAIRIRVNALKYLQRRNLFLLNFLSHRSFSLSWRKANLLVFSSKEIVLAMFLSIFSQLLASFNTSKAKNIWSKKEIGEYNDKKCHLKSFLLFLGLLGNLSAVLCTYKVCGLHQRVVRGHRDLIINRESTAGGKGGKDWSFNYLPQVSNMNFYFIL